MAWGISAVHPLFRHPKLLLLAFIAVLGVVALALLLFRGPAVVTSVTAAPGNAIESIIRALSLDPRVVVQNNTIVLGGQHAKEFISYEYRFRKENVFESTELGSTQRVVLRADWTAKLGYRMNRDSRVTLDGTVVTLEFEGPLILALECADITSVSDDGWWNRVSDAERDQAMRQFRAFAERDAQEWELKIKTATAFKQMMDELLRPLGYTTDVRSTTL